MPDGHEVDSANSSVICSFISSLLLLLIDDLLRCHTSITIITARTLPCPREGNQQLLVSKKIMINNRSTMSAPAEQVAKLELYKFSFVAMRQVQEYYTDTTNQ
jgi:hypothetical protein